MTLDRSIGPRCNIGPDEVARRKRSAAALTAVAAVAAAVLIAVATPALLRWVILWPLASAAAVTWLQVVRRFCVAFGALGLENFGRLRQETRVDPGQRAADRRRALLLFLEGSLIGLVVALTVVAIPVG